MRRFLIAAFLMAVLCMMVSSGTITSYAQQQVNHFQQPSTHCAMKLIKHQAGHSSTYICFDRQGRAISKGVVSPNFVDPCLVVVYTDGPFYPTTGSALCFNQSGNVNIPPDFNDQASSWLACTGGVFFVNSNEGGGSGSYSAMQWGNFPYKGVPNDSLSSISINPGTSCNIQIFA